MKSKRNKTIDITVEEGKEYLERCIDASKIKSIQDVMDKTIIGDMFEIASLLPPKSVDLLIADPPYNLDKDFNGNK